MTKEFKQAMIAIVILVIVVSVFYETSSEIILEYACLMKKYHYSMPALFVFLFALMHIMIKIPKLGKVNIKQHWSVSVALIIIWTSSMIYAILQDTKESANYVLFPLLLTLLIYAYYIDRKYKEQKLDVESDSSISN